MSLVPFMSAWDVYKRCLYVNVYLYARSLYSYPWPVSVCSNIPSVSARGICLICLHPTICQKVRVTRGVSSESGLESMSETPGGRQANYTLTCTQEEGKTNVVEAAGARLIIKRTQRIYTNVIKSFLVEDSQWEITWCSWSCIFQFWSGNACTVEVVHSRPKGQGNIKQSRFIWELA